MSLEQLTGLLREFGFPVFVATWFMFRLEKRMDRQSELLASLMQAMAMIAKAIEAKGAQGRAPTEPPPTSPVDKE